MKQKVILKAMRWGLPSLFIILLAGLPSSDFAEMGVFAAEDSATGTRFEQQQYDCSQASHNLVESECEALVQFYWDTGGPEWDYMGKWLNSDNPCGWGFFSCKNQHVVGLSLTSTTMSEPGISGDIGALSGLTHLQWLTIDDSPGLTGDLSTFSTMADLESLVVKSGTITGNAALLDVLPNLEKIWLPYSQISGRLSDLASLDLYTLYMPHASNFSGSTTDLALFPSLRYLDLSYVPFSGDIADLHNLPQLRRVKLTGTSVAGHIGSISGHPNLEQLDMSHSAVGGNLDELVNSQIRYLYLSHTNITGTATSLNDLCMPVEIFVDHNDLTGPLPSFPIHGNCLSPVSVQKIDFAANQFSGPIPRHWSSWTLEYVRLGCNAGLYAEPEMEAWLNANHPDWNTCDGMWSGSGSGSDPGPPPLNQQPDNTAMQGAGMPDEAYATVHMLNGAWQYNAGGVPQELVDNGVIVAVDVWMQKPDGQTTFDFPDGYEKICLEGEGRIIFFDATTSPREMHEITPVTLEDGYTCGWIPNAGTVVLIEG